MSHAPETSKYPFELIVKKKCFHEITGIEIHLIQLHSTTKYQVRHQIYRNVRIGLELKCSALLSVQSSIR